MPDYGHSKAYSLLPNYCPETDPIYKNAHQNENKEERELKEAKEKAKREKESKIEYIMLQKALANQKDDLKNKEKYDVQLLMKNQEFTYKLFDETRYQEIVRKAKQRILLGDDEGKTHGAGRIISHQSQLRTMPAHAIKPKEQCKLIEEILLRMVAQSQRIIAPQTLEGKLQNKFSSGHSNDHQQYATINHVK